jgi:hypothetical protein
MNATVKVIKRWMLLDEHLLFPRGISVVSFAERHGFSVRTIRRDVAAIRALGQTILKRRFRDKRGDGQDWLQYPRGFPPLFTRNQS